MYWEYKGVWIEIYAGDYDEEADTCYWSVYAPDCLGDRFTSVNAARFAAMQHIEFERLSSPE